MSERLRGALSCAERSPALADPAVRGDARWRVTEAIITEWVLDDAEAKTLRAFALLGRRS